MNIRVTMFFKPFPGMTPAEERLEGGATDMQGNLLYSLEEYIMGDARYVSLARDFLGGPPGSDPRFRTYGTRVVIPQINGLLGWDYIDFRLVDTGDHFHGPTKVVKEGAEPIDVCRKKPLFLPKTEGLMTLVFFDDWQQRGVE